VSSLFQDLRYAGRSLRRRPAFTAVAVLTLALGIGGTAAVLSVTKALFSATLPIPQADRVVAITEHREQGSPGQVVQYPDYVAYRDGAASVFAELAAVGNRTFAASTGQGTESLPGAFVSGNYFRILRVGPALGRYLTPEDDQSGAAPVVVLSHRLWQSRFNGYRGVLGRTLHPGITGRPC
jgi:putative ABC transport system permease protein